MHLAGTDTEVPAALVQPEEPATSAAAAGVAGGSFAASVSDLSHAAAHVPSVIEGAGNDQAQITELPDPNLTTEDLEAPAVQAPSAIEGAGDDQAQITELPDPEFTVEDLRATESPAAPTPAPEQAPSASHSDHDRATADARAAAVHSDLAQPPALNAVQTAAEGSHGSDSRKQLSPKNKEDEIEVHVQHPVSRTLASGCLSSSASLCIQFR